MESPRTKNHTCLSTFSMNESSIVPPSIDRYKEENHDNNHKGKPPQLTPQRQRYEPNPGNNHCRRFSIVNVCGAHETNRPLSFDSRPSLATANQPTLSSLPSSSSIHCDRLTHTECLEPTNHETIPTHMSSSSSSSSSNPNNHYTVLELKPPPAVPTELQVKQAYRRLALHHHPDRLPATATKVERRHATQRFQDISQAYHVLSDTTRRAQYDASLLHHNNNATVSTTGAQQRPDGGGSPYQAASSFVVPPYHDTHRVDPFAQFNHLFQHDAFFRQAFDNLEQEFVRHFEQQDNNPPHQQSPSPTMDPPTRSGTTAATTTGAAARQASSSRATSYPNAGTHPGMTTNGGGGSGEGWFLWVLRQCGIQVHMTTRTVNAHTGHVTASTYSSTPRTRGGSSYTHQQIRTQIDPRTGQRVTIRSMERNDNRLQEAYHATTGQLLERHVIPKQA